MLQKKFFLIGFSFLFASLVHAQSSEYGSVILKSGQGYVVRAGKKIDLPASEPFVVFNDDLIRLLDNSNGVLMTSEKAQIDLGSNAILKVKSWSEGESRGFLSLLYGKIKATIAGLRSEESFNIKTANSVIGVKGTSYSAGTSYAGDSYVWTISDYTYFTDSLRKRQMVVPNGYYSSNLKSEGLQKMVAVEREDVTSFDLASAKPGEDKKMSFADEFFVKRTDVGALPFINRESLQTRTQSIQQSAEEIKTNSIIKINWCGCIN